MDIHTTSLFLFNTFLIPVTFFSLVYYLLALRTIFAAGDRKETPEPEVEGETKWPKVTVQIPTFNEPVAIRCAKAALKFDYPAERFEIILGDDSTESWVSNAIAGFALNHPRRVKVTRRGHNNGFKAGNLNHMLKVSRGEIIVIFDSDFVADPDFLKKMVQPFLSDDQVAGVQAGWDFLNERTNYISKLASTLLMFYYSLIAPLNKKVGSPFLFGSGEAIKKDLLVKMGGWKEGSLTEDTEFSLRVLKNGYKIIYLNDVKVKGELPYTLKGLMSQQRRWSYGNTRAFLTHARAILLGPFSLLQKVMITYTTSIGYLSNLLLLLFLVCGFIYFFSQPPAPIDMGKFIGQTAQVFLVTSGFMLCGVIALFKKKKLDILAPSIISIMTVGVLVSLSVCIGFFKALSGRSMVWSAINKEGNLDFAHRK